MLNRRRSYLSPLLIHPPKSSGAVCSFGFFMHDDGVLREQHVANAHSVAIAKEFILRWRERGGQVIDLRPQDQRPEQESNLPQSKAVQSMYKKVYFSPRQRRTAGSVS